MVEASFHFPPGFLWGTATSSHQVEGFNIGNDWWAWEEQEGHIAHGHRSGPACEWWSGRWREDFDRAAEAAQNAHRLSIEWSRIEPRPGVWDSSALDAYRQMIEGARRRGMVPMVTLHHFTNPVWLMEMGGWLAEAIVDWFPRYVHHVVDALSDVVDLWVTINEPNVYAVASYLAGAFPPGEHSLRKVFAVVRNMTLAHAASYRTIHELQPQAKVGLAHHYRGMQPSRPGNPLDVRVSKLRSAWFNDLIPCALHDGWVRWPGRRERLSGVGGTQDFFGLNYYTTEVVKVNPLKPSTILQEGGYPEGSDLSPSGFIANVPQGFWTAMRWARRFGLPIYITENGVEDETDKMRPRYLAQHLRALWGAVNFNWGVEGYFHWTLVDNFEWERGWTQRFGLWGLDPKTQARSKRPSADFYAEVCKANALASETVARYAPGVFDKIFPPSPPGDLAQWNGNSEAPDLVPTA